MSPASSRVAQQPVHEELVFVGIDATVAVLVYFVNVGFYALGNKCFRDLLKAIASQAFTFCDTLSQKHDRFHQTVVFTVSLQTEVAATMAAGAV